MIAQHACKDIRTLIPRFAERKLEARESAAVEEHLRGCPACREAAQRFAEVQGLLSGAYGEAAISRTFNETTGHRMHAVSTGPVPEIPYEEEEAYQPAPAGFLDSLAQRFGAAPWWTISGAFHGLLILLLFLIGMAIMQIKKNDTVILTSLEKQREKEPEKEQPPRDVFKNPQPIETTELAPTPEVVMHEEVEIAEHNETDQEMDAHEAFGDEGISDIPLGGSGISGAIGVGGGGAGAFGRPTGGGSRLRRAMAGGGGKATESAVDKALEWLARNQEADGHWDCIKHGGQDNPAPDTGATALALLAFLGAGHTEKVGKYKDNVRRAQDWLIAQQKPDGVVYSPFRGNGYCHAIAGLALAEAAAMGRNPKIKEAAQKALDYSCSIHQNGEGSDRLGWRYKKKERGDTSVSGWFIMQLKSAKVAGLQVDPASFEGANKYLNAVEYEKHDPAQPYSGGMFEYRDPAGGGSHKIPSVCSVGMLSALFMGRDPDTLGSGVKYLLAELPEWKVSNGGKHGAGGGHPLYYWYYGTLAMFQVGGDSWKAWNEAMKKALLTNQRVGGPEDGSWDPFGTEGVRGGRVVCTALGVLSLEVYYRYLPMYR